MQHILDLSLRRRVHVPSLAKQPPARGAVRGGRARHLGRDFARGRRHPHLVRDHLLHGRLHARRVGARAPWVEASGASCGRRAPSRLPRAPGACGRPRGHRPPHGGAARVTLRDPLALLAWPPGSGVCLGGLLSPSPLPHALSVRRVPGHAVVVARVPGVGAEGTCGAPQLRWSTRARRLRRASAAHSRRLPFWRAPSRPRPLRRRGRAWRPSSRPRGRWPGAPPARSAPA